MAPTMMAARATAVLRAPAARPAARPMAARPAAPLRRSMRTAAINSEIVGGNYANALVEIAQDKNALEAVHSDMDSLSAVFTDSADVAEYLQSPLVSEDDKKKMIGTLGSEAGFNEYTVNFLNLLVDKQRMDVITEVIAAFETRYCQLTDTQVATLRSAVKLEQEQQFLIAKKLQELTGSKNIKLKPVFDESLIAGFVVEYGSNQIDLSVRGAIDRVKTQLETVQV